jgi:eukaryotic-like serine/threonine-protein kinase
MTAAGDLTGWPGRTLGGKYRVVRAIGHGGVGSVYEAEGPGEARFAVKILDPAWAKDPEAAGRFAREARAASDVESPHIVRVVDGGTESGSPYLVMELLTGEDLGTRLRRERRLGLDEAFSIVEQVLAGLVAAHAASIVHRDLKPENVFLVPGAPGEPGLVKIVDFGMSKRERPMGGTKPLPLTRRGRALGTPLYMSPEQARAASDVDARSDLFAVGAVLFECLTGRPPFVGETYEQILLKICMEDAPDVRRWAPEVPDALAAVVGKALERDRERRYASADAMLAAVRGIGTLGAGDEARLRRRARARMLVAAGIAILAGALVTLLAVALVGK